MTVQLAESPSDFNARRRLAGTRLGRYQVGPRLGAGGTASVYLARLSGPHNFERLVALKVVHDHLSEEREFIAQFLQLIAAEKHPEVLDQNTAQSMRKLAAHGYLAADHAELLIGATELVHNLTQILRLCLVGAFDPEAAPKGMKELLVRAGDAPTFAALELRLKDTLASVESLFEALVV